MRIEGANNRQITFVVTAQDLQDRRLTMKQLSYGSKATAELFYEILNTAASQYGFNKEGLPVKIEAIPEGDDELLVIISAVEDPEELDPQYAQYADLDALRLVSGQAGQEVHEPERVMNTVRVCLVSFKNIDEVISFCRKIGSGFPGKSELYRNRAGEGYYLALTRPEVMPAKEYNVFLNRIMEYAELVPGGSILYAHLKEHETAVMDEPLRKLSEL